MVLFAARWAKTPAPSPAIRRASPPAALPTQASAYKEGDASVMVFAGRPKGLRNNQHVRVTGKFTKLKRVGSDTFRNAVEAYRVVVLR